MEDGDSAVAAGPAAQDSGDDGSDNLLMERDDEGNIWVINLVNCVVMRKAAGPEEELQVVGRWDPVAQAVVLQQEEDDGIEAVVRAMNSVTVGCDSDTMADTGKADSGEVVMTATAAEEVAAALPPPPLTPPLAPPLTPDVLRRLNETGYALVDGVLDEATAGDTRRELEALINNNRSGSGGGIVLYPMSEQSTAMGRSDSVAWLRWRGGAGVGDGRGADESRGVLAPRLARGAIETLASVATQLASEGWDGGAEIGPAAPHRNLVVPATAQLAVYRGVGARYEKHLDNVQTPGGWWVNGRAYTAILYLNDSWQAGCGGCLRLHVDRNSNASEDPDTASYVDVEPVAGRLVVFSSQKVMHEVMPVAEDGDSASRFAITLWILDPGIPLQSASSTSKP